MKADLSHVTLIGIDCVNAWRLLRAARLCLSVVRPEEVKLLSSSPLLHNPIPRGRWQLIEHLNSQSAYSDFCFKRLPDFVDTQFALIFQWDGYAMSGGRWTKDFLDYDYVGGWSNSWQGMNGGFCLRSKRMLEACRALLGSRDPNPEDIVICRHLRPQLESMGMKFAPKDVAEVFAATESPWRGEFGFHGIGCVRNRAAIQSIRNRP